MKASRGGLTLKTGKIGRTNVLRQQMLMPHEKLNIAINGSVRLTSLRERDVMRINAHLATFMTPLRWLWSQFADYVKEGRDTAITPPVVTGEPNFAKYGVGSYEGGTPTAELFQWFKDAPLRIYNEWYKWPEDADATSWNDDGNIAVPLSKAWSRCRYSADPDNSNDYTVSSSTSFDVRELATRQARFRSAMKRDVLSFNRWQELVGLTWGGDGSREVDQVPMLIDQIDVGVNPREIPATDGASLGEWQSLYDFGVNHNINGIIAPEHCILTTILTVRFASVAEGCHPLSNNRLDWFELTADPEWLAAEQPVEVQVQDLKQGSNANVLGYLPAGWQWRTDHDVIGERIDTRNSYPYMLFPGTQAEAKDATRIRNAFRSSALGDYQVDLYFNEDSQQPIGSALDSYFSGMLDDTAHISNDNAEFPFGGKQL